MRQQLLQQVRGRALIPDVLAQVLSLLPTAQQLRAGLVSREWRVVVQHPSLWRTSGWWSTRVVDQPDAMPLPAWLCARLPLLRCDVNWLLSAAQLSHVCSFVQLRHLELHGKPGGATVSADVLRQALSPLQLQTLILPHVIYGPFVLPPPLLTALTEPSAAGQPPLLVQWSASLTRLECEFKAHPEDAILRVLSDNSWPMLRQLEVHVCCSGTATLSEIAVAAAAQRLQWLNQQTAPLLTSLKWHSQGRCWDHGCVLCPAVKLPHLSGVHSLTELQLRWERWCSILDLLRLIHADALPRLRRLIIDGNMTAPSPGDEELEAVALLERMPLTALGGEGASSVGIGPLLHHLPQLEELSRFNVKWRSTASVAAASKLQRFAIHAWESPDDVVQVFQHWWHRLGCPPLRTNGRVDEAQWRKHLEQKASESEPVQPLESLASPTPGLRELVVRPVTFTEYLPIEAIPYMAHLPNLRVLECSLPISELPALGLLPQLEELRLRPTYCHNEDWCNAALRALGRLPLPLLHTLRLCNTNERDVNLLLGDEQLKGPDPDFPWGDESTDDWRGAPLLTAVTLAGLRSLLQLPALAALDLPWIDERVLEQFRQLAQQQGRAALHIERPVPVSRRPRLDRHWLSVDQLKQNDE